MRTILIFLIFPFLFAEDESIYVDLRPHRPDHSWSPSPRLQLGLGSGLKEVSYLELFGGTAQLMTATTSTFSLEGDLSFFTHWRAGLRSQFFRTYSEAGKEIIDLSEYAIGPIIQYRLFQEDAWWSDLKISSMALLGPTHGHHLLSAIALGMGPYSVEFSFQRQFGTIAQVLVPGHTTKREYSANFYLIELLWGPTF